jgi:ATP-dependent helicase/nuclease subunit A
VTDRTARDRALDPRHSFIVQAPAGSGKTELLIQRFLVLLARVERPESVVAITFTIKAAAEMRRRVLDALAGSEGPAPAEPHKAATWRLARSVSERDAARGWNLAENPNRLAISTIDSLCYSLIGRMPWLSRCGAAPAIEEKASKLYEEAARRTIALLEEDDWEPYLSVVLLHLDNDVPALERLLADMLARRDHWLRHIAGADLGQARGVLEDGLRNVVREAVGAVCTACPPGLEAEFLPLARHAAANLGEPGLACLPGEAIEQLEGWLSVARLLLTNEGEWRKGINKTIGFPPTSRREKQLFEGLLAGLARHEPFRRSLHALRRLPPPAYTDQQWTVLAALVRVLQCAAAQLDLVFRERGVLDFIGVNRAAIEALGEEGRPTDLALVLDYRIQHLLIDEFQDTSITQFELLRGLVAGWEPGDGRTLFAVGDPMQSIYRFREAEVGLFLEAWRDGIGGLRLEPLRLSANFRSGEGLVVWVNSVFPDVLPAADDVDTGAVRFSPSEAVRPPGPDPAVCIHPLIGDRDDEAEAAQVVEIVVAQPSGCVTAVLVRARTHLPSILSALREAGRRYRAVEIDELGEVSITQDLLALTCALLHSSDRVSWLALLRAPWCGLKLADLHALASGAPHTPVWELMADDSRLERLSEDGRLRLRRVRGVLERALQARPRSLARWVEGAWMALGGPACATGSADLENARAFLDLLEGLDERGEADFDVLRNEVRRLYAGPDPGADDSLQVMTIHRAKGLEFDVVIVPGLGRRPQKDSPRLLAWLERPAAGRADLLLAPIKAAGAKEDEVYTYLNDIEKDKQDHETGRLLYVAATRARRALHLLGHARLDPDTGQVRAPGSDTLLARIWPAVEGHFRALAATPLPVAAGPEPPEVAAASLRRLAPDWSLPEPPPGIAAAPEPERRQGITFQWVGDMLRHIGIVVHRALEQIARDGPGTWNETRVRARRPVYEAALVALGVPVAELADAAETVLRAVSRTLADPRGRWLLETHEDAQSELALHGVRNGVIVAVRIDRTFVEAGVRWIVDFKTGTHEGGNAEAFLESELQRYGEDMARYADLLSGLDRRPIRMGLYFPLLGAWREYGAADARQ